MWVFVDSPMGTSNFVFGLDLRTLLAAMQKCRKVAIEKSSFFKRTTEALAAYGHT